MTGDYSSGNYIPYTSLGYELFTYNNGVKNKQITASDNELTLRTVVQLDNVKEEGSAAVPARHLIELLKTLPDQPIGLKSVGEGPFECTWSNGNSSLPTFPAADYPEYRELAKAVNKAYESSLVLKKNP